MPQGVIDELAATLTARIGDDFARPALGMLLGSAVLSGIFGNIRRDHGTVRQRARRR